MPAWQGSTPLHKSSGNLNSLRLVESSVCTFRDALSAWAWGTVRMRCGVQRVGRGRGALQGLKAKMRKGYRPLHLHPLLPDLVT